MADDEFLTGDEKEVEGDLDMGMNADGEPIAGPANDPSEEDGFSTDEDETF